MSSYLSPDMFSTLHTPPSTPRPTLIRSTTFGSAHVAPSPSSPLSFSSLPPPTDYLSARPLSSRHQPAQNPSTPPTSFHFAGNGQARSHLPATDYMSARPIRSPPKDGSTSSSTDHDMSPCSGIESVEGAEIWMVNEKLRASPVNLVRTSSMISRSTVPRPLSNASAATTNDAVASEPPKQWSALHVNRRSLPVPPRPSAAPPSREHLPWEGLPPPPPSSTVPFPSPFSPQSTEFFSSSPSRSIAHPAQCIPIPSPLPLPSRPTRPNHAASNNFSLSPSTPMTARQHHFEQTTPLSPSPAHYLPRIPHVAALTAEIDVDAVRGGEAVSLSTRRAREIFDLGEGSSRGIQRTHRPESVVTKKRSASYASPLPISASLPGASYANADIFSPTRPTTLDALPPQALFTPNRSIPPITLPPSSAFRNYLRPAHPPPRPPPPSSYPTYLSTAPTTTSISTEPRPPSHASNTSRPANPTARPRAQRRPTSLPSPSLALYSIRNRLSLLEDELSAEIRRVQAAEEDREEEEERKREEWGRIDAEWAGVQVTWGRKESKNGTKEKKGSWLSRRFSSRKER